MPFDIGFSELLVIGIVALIVIGPRDLPGMFRTMGRFTGKMRKMAREFQRAMEDAADDTGVKGVSKDLKDMTSKKNLGLDRLNEAAEKFEKWDPARPGRKPAPKGPETQKLADERRAGAERTRVAAAARAEAKEAAAAAAAASPVEEPAAAAATPTEDEDGPRA